MRRSGILVVIIGCSLAAYAIAMRTSTYINNNSSDGYYEKDSSLVSVQNNLLIFSLIISIIGVVLFFIKKNGKQSASSIKDQSSSPNYDDSSLNFERKYDNRYPALRFIAQVNRVLAYVYGVIGIIISLYLFFNDNRLFGVYGLVISFFLFMLILAASESIMVFIDIERNTRKNK